jgi:hypothetical protein
MWEIYNLICRGLQTLTSGIDTHWIQKPSELLITHKGIIYSVTVKELEKQKKCKYMNNECRYWDNPDWTCDICMR